MNRGMLLGVASVMGAAIGAVVGVVVRQPEINKLKKQVKDLQSNMSELEDVVERQNEEIARLYASYKSLSALHFLKKREARASLEEALVLQYATVEYLGVVLECAYGVTKLSDEDVSFYKAYGRLALEEDASAADRAVVEGYVMTRHSEAIKSLCQADVCGVLGEIRDYGKATERKGRGLRLPFRRKSESV